MPTLLPILTLTLFLALTLISQAAPPILEARQDFKTKLLREERIGEAAEEPPASSGLKLIQYAAPLGQNYFRDQQPRAHSQSFPFLRASF